MKYIYGNYWLCRVTLMHSNNQVVDGLLMKNAYKCRNGRYKFALCMVCIKCVIRPSSNFTFHFDDKTCPSFQIKFREETALSGLTV